MQIGIDVGATKIESVVLEDNGQESHRSRIACPKDYTSIVSAIKEIHTKLQKEFNRELPIGVCHPGVHSPQTGLVKNAPNCYWLEKKPFQTDLRKALDREVFCENDANCFALGERYFGQAQHKKHVIGLIIGTGFGAGVILNGTLVSGAHCGTGEVGMLPYQGSILEHYCSGQFFERFFSESGAEVYHKAISGDTEAQAKYQSFAKHIAEGIKAVLYAYDPEMIVLGGATSRVWSYIEDTVWEGLSTFAYPQSLKNLIITPSHLEHVAVLGAAALAMDAMSSK